MWICWWMAGGVAVLALGLNAWQWVAGGRSPLDRRGAQDGPWPGVTVLKPLRGADAETRSCLATWLAQDYAGPVQVLFGVADASDPAVAIVVDLLASGSGVGGALELCPSESGVNGKVSKLAHLATLAQYEVLVISDADVAVPPDLLREMVTILREECVGLVNCLYRLAAPRTWALRCEALAVNVDFWSQVLQSRTVWPMDFGLGAVMGIRRSWLSKAGGFEVLVDHLADDFLLGQRVHQAGGRIELCPVIVDCREGPRTWGEVWHHQLRWARTIRVSRPGPYFLSVLSNLILWAVVLGGLTLAGGAMGVVGIHAGLAGTGLAVGCAAWRVLMALDLQRRFVPEPSWRSPWWMVPIKDLLGVAVWVAAFAGDRVEWKGQVFRVARDGRLVAG